MAKRTIHKRGSRDRNEKFITEYLRRANVKYELLPEGFGADILLFMSPMMLVEVKNPEVPEYDRGLTPKEKEVMEFCKEMRIPYHVVETPEEMADIVNEWIERLDWKSSLPS